MKKSIKIFITVFCVFTLIFMYAGKNFAISNTIKFVQLSDIHYTTTTPDNSYKVLSDSKDLITSAVSQINKMTGVDFVIVTGDIVDKSDLTDFKEVVSIMNNLKYPWYYATGNHDVGILGGMSKETLLTALKKYNKNFTFNNLYYAFNSPKGYKIITLDGVIDKIITANGKIPKEQLEWLDTQLYEMKNKDEIALIFLHFPVKEPFAANHHRILNAKELEKVLKKYNFPIAVFSGHYHAEGIFRDKNILHISSPSLVTYPNAFRVATITNEKTKVVFEFEVLGTELTQIQEKSRLKVIKKHKKYINHNKKDKITVIIEK